ncbi:MAG: hypothetical protein MR519_10610 [Spirochaetaceae bacterium]|nr:hypothetical protein [Spirochaetaceae bacterium]
MRTTCSECAKFRCGWCRYKGVIDTAAVKADRRSRLCKPVPRQDSAIVDFGQIDPCGAMRHMTYGRSDRRVR